MTWRDAMRLDPLLLAYLVATAVVLCAVIYQLAQIAAYAILMRRALRNQRRVVRFRHPSNTPMFVALVWTRMTERWRDWRERRRRTYREHLHGERLVDRMVKLK